MTMNTSGAELVEVESPTSFEATVERILRAIDAAGLKLIARLDHSAGAQAFGLELAPTVVLVYGHPRGGTPIMQQHPNAALDLPLRVLVRATSPHRTVIAFHPIVDVLAQLGVPADLSLPLERSQNLVREAALG